MISDGVRSYACWLIYVTPDQRQRDPCPPRVSQGVTDRKVTHLQVADLPTPARYTSVTAADTCSTGCFAYTVDCFTSCRDWEIVLLHYVIFLISHNFWWSLTQDRCTKSTSHSTLLDPLNSPSLLRTLIFLPWMFACYVILYIIIPVTYPLTATYTFMLCYFI